MAETSVRKDCKLCGTNLNGRKRQKNAAGEYYCPSCWQSVHSIFGDDSAVDVVESSPPPEAKLAPPAQARSGLPAVRVVRSELQPTVGQAAADGLKQGTGRVLYKAAQKFLVILQGGLAAALTKKFSPDANNGVLAVAALTGALAGIIETEMFARALKWKALYMDSKDLKSTAGILMIIGFGLAYALAIFLAVIGG